MSFREINDQIKDFYNSTDDNLIKDFYNVVLLETRRYDRLSGYFKSDSLASAAKGISNLIQNGGHMRLLCGAQLSEEDVIAINNADDLKDIISKNFLDDYVNLEDQLIKNHVLLLGWMIANNFLEIKIGINTDGKEFYSEGMLHSKRGILYDENDDCILFMGSVNETKYGWTKNIEDLRIDKSWVNSKAMQGPIKNFNDLWDGKVKSLLVLDVPEASKKQLIEDAPKNLKQVQKIIREINKIRCKSTRQLFPYQKEAIKNWFENDKVGYFEMATGTGKTFTAIKCLEEVLKEESDVLVVISCPYTHIIDQWESNIIDLDLGHIHKFYGSVNKNWRKDFYKLRTHINWGLNFSKPNIILTSHYSFHLEDFIRNICGCNCKKFLIVDEMHHVGAENYSNGLSPNYDYILGLSATPSRFMDYEGNERLIDKFKNKVFEFDIVDALNKINPITQKSFLTPYSYHPIKVGLTNYELEEYKKLNKQIGIEYGRKDDELDLKKIQLLFSKRRSIINNAEEKYSAFRDILRNLDHKDHLIVFCSDKQMDVILKILSEEGLSPRHRFTQKEGTKPSKKYGGLSYRQELLNNFDQGDCKALVAIKCLDEGVDVPSADQVIIMSSTTNPAEYVQRRGRVLRRSPGKELAHIYDLCVIPDSESLEFDRIVNNERTRLIEFVKTSNSESRINCIKLFKKWGIL